MVFTSQVAVRLAQQNDRYYLHIACAFVFVHAISSQGRSQKTLQGHTIMVMDVY